LCALLDINKIPCVISKTLETEGEEQPGKRSTQLKPFFLLTEREYVYLDANPLPNHSYYLLLSEDSVITRLFLRSNEIGDEGARLIGSALSTAKTSNKNLQFLNLAFNCIGDAGAAYLAQGLRLNRALLYLSLTNNRIGDSGAAQFSEVLREFPLTHEEVVERRKLLFQKEAEKMGLVRNAITEKSLPLFLTSLEQQTKEGLLRLLLNRNDFPHDCELYLKINELLEHRNPFNKSEEAAEEEPH
uniref:Leucine-rich repeat-containing protein 71 n=1 Tax=Neogobius melanostomus TaxID=47308 RepID=A0A8C6WEJ0_9GOBI